jgi:small subunit ribosomal protein S6
MYESVQRQLADTGRLGLAQNVYECMFIFDSNAYARDPGSVSGKISKMVEKCGGELLASRLWFEQKLAFPIKGQRKGTYWLSFFRMESGRLAEFHRECQLDDNILRNLTLKVDPRMAEVRVAQASSQLVAAPVSAAVIEGSVELVPDLDDQDDADLDEGD